MPRFEDDRLAADWRLPIATTPLDWRAQGDRLLRLIQAELREGFSVGHLHMAAKEGKPSRKGRRDRVVLLTVSGDYEHIGILIQVEKDSRASLELVGDGEEIDQEAARSWLDAVRRATIRAAQPDPETVWWGIITGRAKNNRPFRLTGNLELGNVRVRGYDFAYEGLDPSSGNMVVMLQHTLWYPIRIEGRTGGYDESIALQRAQVEMRLLCGLLAVAEDRSRWELKQMARATAWPPSEIPRGDQGWLRTTTAGDCELLDLPEWLVDAWRLLGELDWLLRAVDGYYEATRMEEMHPSYSLVAYTGVIEGLGEQLVEREAPERCQACQREMRSSSIRTVVKTLERVLSSERADSLIKRAYSDRSRTVHVGEVMGTEPWFGMNQAFEWSSKFGDASRNMVTVFQMQQAARSLILGVLKEEIGAAESR